MGSGVSGGVETRIANGKGRRKRKKRGNVNSPRNSSGNRKNGWLINKGWNRRLLSRLRLRLGKGWIGLKGGKSGRRARSGVKRKSRSLSIELYLLAEGLMAEHPFSIGQARHDKRVRVERASREFGPGHPAQGRQGLLVLDDHHNRRVRHRVSLDDLLAGSKADLASFCPS